MPLIEVSIAEGRGAEKVGELISLLTATVRDWDDVQPQDISVIVRQVPRDHWGTGGVTIADRVRKE